MNKEKYNQIIDETYKRYVMLPKELSEVISDNEKFNGRNFTQEEFINKCKTDTEFSEKWGLKIEERELSLGERKRIYEMEYTNDIEVENNHWLESKLKTRNIPTKLITLEYNGTKIEVYE